MDAYEQFLIEKDYAKNTIISYLYVKESFLSRYGIINKENLNQFKYCCMEKYSSSTANQRIRGINKYLQFLGMDELKLKGIKVQKRNYIENVISDEEYSTLMNYLLEHKKWKWFLLIRMMAVTGLRVSEVLTIKISDIKNGYADIFGKGQKCRRIILPQYICELCIRWTEEMNIKDNLFINKDGKILTTRGVLYGIRYYGEKCGIRKQVLHPHSFRHFFAKHFLKGGGDIVMLADLLGHNSLDTTRIYLKYTMEEQISEVNKIVTW